jgi:hypothetical protein
LLGLHVGASGVPLYSSIAAIIRAPRSASATASAAERGRISTSMSSRPVPRPEHLRLVPAMISNADR